MRKARRHAIDVNLFYGYNGLIGQGRVPSMEVLRPT
jgi:hypothetical protein